MFSYNWFTYGWGPKYLDTYIPVKTSTAYTNIMEEKLHIDLTNNGSVHKIEPLVAALSAIKDITDKYPPPYTLMLSGGVDSQAMLYAWIQSGIKFNICSVTYNSIFNYHDLKNLIKVMNLLKIKINFIDIDALSFFENELKNYALKYECTSPQICLYMKFSEKIKEGTVIFSGNFLEIARPSINYTIFGLHRYALKTNKNLIPFFFLQTPELAYSLMPYYKINTEKYYLGILNLYEIKVNSLKEGGFPVIPQKTRFSGFEVIKDYFDSNYTIEPLQKLKYANYPSKRVFDLKYRYPLTEVLPYSEDIFSKTLNLW